MTIMSDSAGASTGGSHDGMSGSTDSVNDVLGGVTNGSDYMSNEDAVSSSAKTQSISTAK